MPQWLEQVLIQALVIVLREVLAQHFPAAPKP